MNYRKLCIELFGTDDEAALRKIAAEYSKKNTRNAGRKRKLTDDDIQKIASVVKISRKTLKIVKQNIVFALAVKAVVLIMGALGLANMWEAVFADVGVSVLAILNAMRALKYKG